MLVNVSADGKTTPKQELFIQARLAGNTIVASATIAGVSEKTAHVWLKQESVQTAYKEAQHAVFEQSLALLMTDVSDARTTLVAVMKDGDNPPGVRVRAAQIILEQAITLHKTAQLEQEIIKLEELIRSK